jgi:hypothetical protein
VATRQHAASQSVGSTPLSRTVRRSVCRQARVGSRTRSLWHSFQRYFRLPEVHPVDYREHTYRGDACKLRTIAQGPFCLGRPYRRRVRLPELQDSSGNQCPTGFLLPSAVEDARRLDTSHSHGALQAAACSHGIGHYPTTRRVSHCDRNQRLGFDWTHAQESRGPYLKRSRMTPRICTVGQDSEISGALRNLGQCRSSRCPRLPSSHLFNWKNHKHLSTWSPGDRAWYWTCLLHH